MILHLPQSNRNNMTPLLTLLSAVMTYIAVPATAALQTAFLAWAISQNFTLYGAVSDMIAPLNHPLRISLNGLADTYAALLAATLFAFLLSWIGFVFLLPIFHAQRRFGWDGLLPTTLIGAALGALTVMPISLGPLDYAYAARHMFGSNPAPFFSAMGALHAAVFWACITMLTTHSRRRQKPRVLPLFVSQISKSPDA